MTAVRILPYGPAALLAEYDTIEEVIAAAARLRDERPAGVVDVVPAARTVLVTYERPGDPARVERLLREPGSSTPAAGPLVTIEVDYDGADLAEVAARCACSVDEVVAMHCGREYTVAFCGFMPGFAYCVGLDPRLVLPRRSTPRSRVPAGAVAIASEFSAVYPSASPGGWHLLGRTDVTLWDDTRAEPATLPPGARVRYVAR